MLRNFRVLTAHIHRSDICLPHQIALLSGKTLLGPRQEQHSPAQPLSQAIRDLETIVRDKSLPKDVLAANESALATLKTFIEGLANTKSYPKAGINFVRFSIRHGNRLQQVRCQLKTTGGDCSRLVAGNIGEMLYKMGLNPYIYFDGGEFQTDSEREPTQAEVAAVRAKAAAAGFPSQTMTEEQLREIEEKQQAQKHAKAGKLDEADDWSEKLRRLDPLFAAVAAVPWMPTEEDDGERRRHIQTRVLDELEASGWDIRGVAHKVWRGERELQKLTSGKDAGSQAATQSLVYHAKQFDEKYGKRVLTDLK